MRRPQGETLEAVKQNPWEDDLSERELAALSIARMGRQWTHQQLHRAGYSDATAAAISDVLEAGVQALEAGRVSRPLSGRR